MFELDAILITLAPELWLAGAGLLGVLLGAFLGDRFTAPSFIFGAVALAVAAVLSVMHWNGGLAFDGLVQSNPFINFAKTVSYLSAAIALLMAQGFLRDHGTDRYEYALLIIFASLGMGVTLSSANLMVLYLGIEMLSLSSYVLASFHRDSPRSAEAGLKYFVLGALASGMLLYGISLVYGFTGATSYEAIAAADPQLGFMFGMVLMITGLAFKVSAAPMHVWTPDVYEGSPSPVVAFFATAPKMSSMIVFAIIMLTAFPQIIASKNWQLIIAIIAGASMLVGAFGALIQTNLKRLLGYSSIANMGYALVALSAAAVIPAAATPELTSAEAMSAAQDAQVAGGSALLLFMVAYVVASMGLFGGVLSMRREGGMVEEIDELAGLIKRRPALTVALTAIILSVAGFPLAFGFWGKYGVIIAGVNAGLWPLVIILVLSSVIAMYYYLRLVKIMWFDEPVEKFDQVDGWVTFFVYVCAIASIALFIFINPLSELTVAATQVSLQ